MANHLVLSMRKAFILSASFFLILSACKKEGELSPDFVQNTSASFFTDSIKIESKTRKGDSILADRVATGLVGQYQDSAFGKTTASIYLQPLLPTNSLVLAEAGEELLLDSVVLSLEYENFFGDTTVPQTFDVFELAEELDNTTDYFSDTSIQTLPNPLGSKTFTPRPESPSRINQPNLTGGIDTVSLSPQLRIRLSDDLGNRILSKSGEKELDNNFDFLEFFKGIKITPRAGLSFNDNQAAILYFALTATETKMAVFYSVVSASGDTSNSLLNFPINSTSVRFSTFEHDYSIGAVSSNLQNKQNDSLFSLVQAMAGVETALSFPNLKNQFDGQNIVINKAELVLPAASGSYAKFGVASTLVLASRDESGVLQFIPDINESADFFGGDFDPGRGAYVFNIPRFIQGVLNGTQRDRGLTVLVTGAAVKAERVVLLAPGNGSNDGIKLNLFYSKTQ